MTRGNLPKISPTLLRFFARYSEHYLRRHFHAIRLLRGAGAPALPNEPSIIYLNHAAWWDPLVCLFLARRFFRERPSYAPIDAAALARYRFLQKLGFFGVAQNSRQGAAQFLQSARAILSQPESLLWLTPQGHFADVRQPIEFQPGLAHLLKHSPRAHVLPLAIEYTFWEDRKPEVLLAFGDVAQPNEQSVPLVEALAAAASKLSQAAQRRQPYEWESLLRSSGSVQPVYDFWRSLRARFRGEQFQPGHSDL